MKSKNFSGTPDSSGKGRDLLEQAAKSDPRISGMLSKLSDDDMKRLMQVLNDPEKAKSILATPQAQALMRSLQQNNTKGTKGD